MRAEMIETWSDIRGSPSTSGHGSPSRSHGSPSIESAALLGVACASATLVILVAAVAVVQDAALAEFKLELPATIVVDDDGDGDGDDDDGGGFVVVAVAANDPCRLVRNAGGYTDQPSHTRSTRITFSYKVVRTNQYLHHTTQTTFAHDQARSCCLRSPSNILSCSQQRFDRQCSDRPAPVNRISVAGFLGS
jgi:hypothetical protein